MHGALPKENDMRLLLLRVAAGAGLGALVFTTTPASAITMAAPAGVRQRAAAPNLAEDVHCRKSRHRHKNGHRWGRGCSVDDAVINPAVIDPGYSSGAGAAGTRGVVPSRIISPTARSPGNYFNPMNPQDRSGT